MRFVRLTLAIALASSLAACGSPAATDRPSARASATVPSPTDAPSPSSARIVHRGNPPIVTGEPIDLADLSGRILFDDFEDVYAMDVDGSNVVTVAGDPAGSEFDAAWSPDGTWIVYRDSTRGINENDEIAIARADGTNRRLLTTDPANDWGPDWSPDGQQIAFNSDRGGGMLQGYVMRPDGSNVRELGVDAWFEYPSFSPDGTRIAFMGHEGSDYEIFVADVASGAVEQLTDSPGADGWPAWSPDGQAIAFTSERSDCRFAAPDEECWNAGGGGEHHDIWLMDPDGARQRRVSTEQGQFVAWSPDGRYLLISGHALFVVRPDGTGRLELRADGIDRALGGIPDWHAGT